MRDNFCIFKVITHVQSGTELDIPYLNMGNLFEPMDLSGPGLILEFRDTEETIRSQLKIKEFDEITVSYGDPWNEGSVNKSETFIVLSCKPSGNSLVKLSCLAKPVYENKKQANKAKSYSGKSIETILRDNAHGANVEAGDFAVMSNYLLHPGERVSFLLRQFETENTAHIWYNRGTYYAKKFSDLWNATPVAQFHWGTFNESNHIFKYTKLSKQVREQESTFRVFTGWDEVAGRVGASLDLPFLKMLPSSPPTITSVSNQGVLNNMTVSKKSVIDFLAIGKMKVVPGCVLNLLWHMVGEGNPVDEGLPSKIVVENVAHWYSAQKYYMRIRGAVALEPI